MAQRHTLKALNRRSKPQHILSVGNNAELLWLREAVLRNAGYEVLTLTDEKRALSEVESHHCGVLLLCYSLDAHLRQQLANKYREACPEGRIIAITNTPLERTLRDADAFVYGVEGPEALIDAVSGNATSAS